MQALGFKVEYCCLAENGFAAGLFSQKGNRVGFIDQPQTPLLLTRPGITRIEKTPPRRKIRQASATSEPTQRMR